VDEDVDLSEALQRVGREAPGAGFIAHVELLEDGLAAASIDLFGERAARVRREIGDDDAVAVLGQRAAQRRADPAGRSRDDSDLRHLKFLRLLTLEIATPSPG